jgi:hypothetical protein
MKRYGFPATCDICGGEGVGDINVAVAAWTTGVVHTNPDICRENLLLQRRKLDKMKKELENAKAVPPSN